jgi:hypothetical protein
MSTVYLSHSIRGKYGKDATEEQMQANNNRAIAFGNELKVKYPSVDFYVPGEHDEFVLYAYKHNYLTEQQILDVDCRILEKRSMLVVYVPNGYISNGMRVEIDHAQLCGIPVFYIGNIEETYVIDRFLDSIQKG